MTTVRNLKIFLEVYRTHSITDAAKHLYITQPAVTRAIQDLESEYTVRLFERYHRRLIPTAIADHLYTYSDQIVSLMDGMEKMLKQEQVQAKIRIGASITIGTFLMTEICQKFSKVCSNTELEVTILNGTALQSKVLDNSLDIALIEDSIHERDLKAVPFFHDEMLLIMSKDHPLYRKKTIILKDIAEYPLLMREKGSAGREYVDALFARYGMQIMPKWESGSTQALINAVRSGLGISILPSQLCQEALHKKQIVSRSIYHEPMKRTFYIAAHKEKYITKELKQLQNVCMSLSAH